MNGIICISIVLMALLSESLAADGKETSPYKYVISMVDWEKASTEDWEKVSISLNGKQIGSPPKAFETIANLPVEKGDSVKIEVKIANTKVGVRAFQSSHFIQALMAKDAKIDIFEDGKKLKFHAVTWTSFIRKGNFVKNLDEAVWVCDGRQIGDGAAMAEKLEKLANESKFTVLYLHPLGWVPPDLVEPGVVTETFDRLIEERKLKNISVIPLRDVSQKFADEVLFAKP